MKTKLAIGLSAIALFGATTAWAAHEPRGNTTRAEAQAHALEMFAKMDANKDGKLDHVDRAAHQGEMFDHLDANKDGSISREEFLAAHSRGPGGPGEGGPRGDRGGPGEGGPRMAHRGGPGGGMGMMMLRMADANKDGAVTQAEFTGAFLAHFDKADANKDGTLTPDERRAAHEQMRKHMEEKRGMHGDDPHGA